MISARLQDIILKAQNNERLTKDDCKYLLSFPAHSLESSVIRSAANDIIRKKNDNSAIIIGQVGTDIHPCNANCGFCSFGECHTGIPTIRIEKPALENAITGFCKEGDLYGLYLMTMADTDKDFLLENVAIARKAAAKETQIWVNTGDNDRGFYEELVAAGASGAYHVCRLREGIDTKLDPARRLKSMEYIVESGLQLFSCCEPISMEHSIEELADNIFLCIDLGVTQFGAMKRVAVPGSPLYKYGQISNLQMAHVMGCVGLVYASVPSARYFGVHEPCESGYLSGANFVTAETGANPRDIAVDTSKGRGWDMNRCRKLLYECGFSYLRKGDESKIVLDFDYLAKTDSLI